MEIIKNQRYRYNSIPHWILSRSSMEPIWKYVTIVWVDGENIHYRKDGTSLVEQTTSNKFLENFELEN